MSVTAAERWARMLAAWAIPPHILAAAPESPWGYPTAQFARRADAAMAVLTPSNHRALALLPRGGSVLDVGCGAGASSLPLARTAGHLVGVDPSPSMLDEFRARVQATGAAVTTLQGDWPAVAVAAPVADVVVCHHVAYNVPDLAAFARRLTDHARYRVVLELTARHPLTALHDLWLHFHGLARPTTPTADDALALLREAGLAPAHERWVSPELTYFATQEDMVAWTRRRLCLAATRDGEIERALSSRITRRPDGTVAFPARPLVTLWWEGGATGSISTEQG